MILSFAYVNLATVTDCRFATFEFLNVAAMWLAFKVKISLAEYF